VKQRFLDCFLKILDKKRKKWRELLPDQYMSHFGKADLKSFNEINAKDVTNTICNQGGNALTSYGSSSVVV
jgi:hypothetical protein